MADAFKLALMLGDVRLNEEKEGVAGDVYILDASVATPTHFAKFTPTLVKKFLVCVQVSSFCLYAFLILMAVPRFFTCRKFHR